MHAYVTKCLNICMYKEILVVHFFVIKILAISEENTAVVVCTIRVDQEIC